MSRAVASPEALLGEHLARGVEQLRPVLRFALLPPARPLYPCLSVLMHLFAPSTRHGVKRSRSMCARARSRCHPIRQHDLAELAAGREALVGLLRPVERDRWRRPARVTSPDSTSGSTWRSTSRGARAFSSSGRGAQRRAVDAAALAHQRQQVELGLRRPRRRRSPRSGRPWRAPSRLPGRFGAPTSSRTTSKGPCSSKPSGSIAVAPSSSTSARSVLVADGGRHARAGRAAELHRGACPRRPRRRARAGARRRCSSAWVKSASWAVVKTSGTPPACGQSSASGTGIAPRSCTTASSAWPPPPTTAITRSPSLEAQHARPERRPPRRPARARGCRAARPAAPGSAPAALEHVGAVQARPRGRARAARPCPGPGRDAPRRRPSRR